MSRWPRPTSPAWLVHAGLVVVGTLASVAYVFAEPHLQPVIFTLVTLVPIVTFGIALGTRHLTHRRPWMIAMAGLVLLSLSMAYWSDWVSGHHLGRAEGRVADFAIASAHLLFLFGAGGVLRKHGANDAGGMLDAALFGVCTAGPIWAWLIAPRLTEFSTPLGEMLLIADIAVLAAVVGCLARIGTRARRASGPIGYLALCCLVTMAAHLSGVLTASGGGTDATSVLLMFAYLTIAAAPIHPAAPLVTKPDRPGREVSGEPPLVWIGVALCANPLIAAVQAISGDSSANVLLAVGSVLAVPLVLLRLRQMSVLRSEAERTLAHHAHHDELTGLANRRHVGAEIDRALDDLRAGHLDQVTVLLFDLDGFKPINDRFGHSAGDAVLRAVASRLCGAVEREDVVGRLGGDEFLVLRRGRSVADLADRVGDLLSLPIEVDGATVRVGVSAGAASAGPGYEFDRDTLIGRADAEMYVVKATHRLGRDEIPSSPISAPPVRLS